MQSRGRILLVEDDEPLSRVLQSNLEHAGYLVTATQDAGEFLAALVEDNPFFDVAIVDLRLPGLNGNLAISWIKDSEEKQIRDMPIIVLTGSPDLVDSNLEDLPSVRHVLFKPCPTDRLLACVRDCISPAKLPYS